jgi:hypothetical protein
MDQHYTQPESAANESVNILECQQKHGSLAAVPCTFPMADS